MFYTREKLVFRLSDLKKEPMDWLWPDRIAAGSLTLIDGDPSLGKSLLTLDLAARLTTAQSLPDGYVPPQPVSVVLVGHHRCATWSAGSIPGSWRGRVSGLSRGIRGGNTAASAARSGAAHQEVAEHS